MTIWGTYIIVILNSVAHILAYPSTERAASASLLKTIRLPLLYSDASLLDISTVHDSNGCITTQLRWLVQDTWSELHILLLSCEEKEGAEPQFTTSELCDHEGWWSSGPEKITVTQYCIGASRKQFFWLSSSNLHRWIPPSFHIAPIRPPNDTEKVNQASVTSAHATVSESIVVPKAGMPLSLSIPCLDFDDGHGIVLFGSHAGEFCCLFFVSPSLLSGKDVAYELPKYRKERTSSYVVSQVFTFFWEACIIMNVFLVDTS